MLLGGMLIVFVYLLQRNVGLHATIFGDEYVYSMHSRYYKDGQFTWPNFLYFRIYAITSLFGQSFLEAARMLNAFFWILTALPIYAIAKKILGDGSAVAAALFAIILPSNMYTAFFMPEATYFLFFWALLYVVIEAAEKPSRKSLVIVSIVFALASLIKPHALFLIPAFLVFGFFKFRDLSRVKTSAVMSLMILASMALKFGLGFLLAGKSGLTLLGGTYSGAVQSGSGSGDVLRLVTVFTSGFRLAPAHLLALSLIFGIVFVSSILTLQRADLSTPKEIGGRDYTVLALAVTLNLIVVAALFTTLVAGVNSLELSNRIHERYYFQIFPFFIILGLWQLKKGIDNTALRARLALSQIPILGLALATVGFFSTFSIQLVDQPDYYAILLFPVIACTWALANLANQITWVLKPALALKIFAFFLFPIYLGMSHWQVNNNLALSHSESRETSLAKYLLNDLPTSAKIQIVGSDIISSYRLAFELDKPDIVFVNQLATTTKSTTSSELFAVMILQPGAVISKIDGYELERHMGFTIARKTF